MCSMYSSFIIHDRSNPFSSAEDDFKKVLEDVNDEKLIVDKLPVDVESFEDSTEGDTATREELRKVETIDDEEKEKEIELARMEEMMMEEVRYFCVTFSWSHCFCLERF